MSSVTAQAIEKLEELSGTGRQKTRVETARQRLARINAEYWRRREARGRIDRFLSRRQKPNADEIEDIRRAYARYVPEKIEANRAENLRLIASLRTYIETALQSDPEFFGPQIEVVRQIIGDLGGDADPSQQQGRGQTPPADG